MLKKSLLLTFAFAIAIATVPMFAAFEAHVINVTAKIENALSVPLELISFGTVFPQEELEKDLSIALSSSFLTEERVDDVEYIIRQKPKCGVTADEGETLVGPTWTGHVVVIGNESEGYDYTIDCDVDEPENLILGSGESSGLLPSLCEYISKHPDQQDNTVTTENPNGNDGSLDSFHEPFTINQSTGAVEWNDTLGRLAKSDNDEVDNWTIDLAVPCFGGNCAQDWESFVRGVNPEATAADYVQDLDNEHKIFGCNLWVEVTEVSEFTSET